MGITLARLGEVISDIVISTSQTILLTRRHKFSYQINAVTVLQIPEAVSQPLKTLTI